MTLPCQSPLLAWDHSGGPESEKEKSSVRGGEGWQGIRGIPGQSTRGVGRPLK